MNETANVFVGIDWGTRAHQVGIFSPSGRQLDEREVAHSPEQLFALCDRLTNLAHGDPSLVLVAIERPDGLVVDTLLERGFRVFTLNPKQLDRFRDRFSPSGAKDDRRDARVLASALRTDPSAFREVDGDSPAMIVLRELAREHEDLTRKRVRIQNQAVEMLRRYFPSFLQLGTLSPWLIALWHLVPTPSAADKPGVSRRIATLVRKHGVRRHTASSVLEILRTKPRLKAADGVEEAVCMRLARLLEELALLLRQIDESVKAKKERLKEMELHESGELSDASIVQSAPGVGAVVASILLAEGGRSLRARDYRGIRSLAGVAPVTRRSGRSHVVVQRQACNRRLREGVFHWARVISQTHEPTKKRYAELRARGHSNGRALRAIGDQLLRMLCAMLRDRTMCRWNAA